jgi:CHASE3 domain sensor protein
MKQPKRSSKAAWQWSWQTSFENPAGHREPQNHSKDGTTQMIRKAALQAGAFALLALMAWNAYLAISHLNQTKKIAELTLENSRMQAEISAVLRDFADMETGQRGYLLTANPSYLQPYTDARSRIASDLSRLRQALVNRPERARAMEAQLESLAASKQAEMEHTIDLRQQGYRHRAFVLVNSNEGMEYMEKARGLLSSLSQSEKSSLATLDAEKNARLRKALLQTIVANLSLFALMACLFAGARYHGKALEKAVAQDRHKLALRDLQLQKLTSALSTQARIETSAIEQNARLLLENYGGFLPRQGHEYAEQIEQASAQMERLRQDLLADPGSSCDDSLLYESVA